MGSRLPARSLPRPARDLAPATTSGLNPRSVLCSGEVDIDSVSTGQTEQRTAELPSRVDIAIIGAGPGGLCGGIALRRAGIEDFLILEQAPEVGGTWWHNRYPGAECDVQSHLYSFTFEPKPDWTRPYAGQAEILEYLRHVASKHGMRPHCRFGVAVRSARWNHERGQWRLETSCGQMLEARIVISAIGMFNDISVPDIPGLGNFSGACFHTARWEDDHDLRGERVAVIGSAASAVQTIPEIAPLVAQLDVYQRTPQWVLPKADEPFTAAEIARFREDTAAMAEHRQDLYRQLESAILFDNPVLLAEAEAAGLRNLAQVHDPDLRRRLTPAMRYGCRRPLLSNKYYPTFNRTNVALVDCGIDHVVADGIVGKDGLNRRVDTIILATGFETTKFLSAIDVTGRDGQHINDAWRDGAQAYLGMTTSGFPNLFMLYGPNTNNGSLIYMLELEVAYIVRQIQRMNRERLFWIDVRRDVMDDYNAQLQRDIAGVGVWAADCRGYYRAESGRVVTQLPYNMTMWQQRTAQADADAYESAPAEMTAG